MNIMQVTGTMFSQVWGTRSVTDNMLSAILSTLRIAGEGTALNNLTSIGGGIIISLVISIAVLIGAFRLFFELLKSYFSVVVSVVTAPVVLMLGAVPGKNVFWPWLKNIIGNLAAFPTVLLSLVLFLEFTKAENLTGTAGGFMPPFLMGSGASQILAPMMGLAIILALPDIVKKAKTALGASEGGVLWELAGAAAKNAGRAADYAENAIPLAIAPVTTGRQMLRTFNAAKQSEGATNRQAFRKAVVGGKIEGKEYGGMATGWRDGIKRGMAIRKQVDRIRGGRFFDPEDATNLLSRIAENQEKDKREKPVENIKDQVDSGG
jgi:hypothetical protein